MRSAGYGIPSAGLKNLLKLVLWVVVGGAALGGMAWPAATLAL
jgi:hypothetical protein